MDQERQELMVRDLTGKPHSRLIEPDNMIEEMRKEVKRVDISQICLMTTRPLGCILMEMQRDASSGWTLHRLGVNVDKRLFQAIVAP